MSTYVRTDWVARNEYTTPIKEVPIYRNSGIIKAVTKENEKIQVKMTARLTKNVCFKPHALLASTTTSRLCH